MSRELTWVGISHGQSPEGRTVTLQVSMNYPGKEISKNCLWHGGDRRQGMNRTARRWKRDLAESLTYLLLHGSATVRVPVSVLIGCNFTDRHSACDPHNLGEIVCDAVQEATGINDKFYSLTTLPARFGAVFPEIVVRVTLGVEA